MAAAMRRWPRPRTRAYLADFLAGKDTLLLANSNAEARDLSRRVQGYLREWGKLGAESAELREGSARSTGDRLIARHNRKDGAAERDDRCG